MSEPEPRRRSVVPAERRRIILDLLREQGSINVVDVEERFHVSPMTARRDLAILAEGGLARRTHGGALLPELAAHEDSFTSRVEQGAAVKTRLAKVVARTINPHETVFIDCSSTAYFVVRELLELALPLTVLTNSLPVMSLIGSGPGSGESRQLELIGIGGRFRTLTRSFVGAEAVRIIERHFVDRVVFSVKGIEPAGYLTDPDPLEAEVKRAMIERARTVSLVADARKLEEHGLNVVIDAAAVDTAYLGDPSPAGVRMLQAAGVAVVSV